MKNFLITFLMLTGAHLIQGQTRPYQTPTKQIVDSRSLKEILNFNGKKDTEVLNVIVEFKEEPLFISNRKSTGFKKSSVFYEQRFTEFSSAIGIASVPKKSLNKSSVRISHEYYKAFFGARISIPSDKIGMITSLPYVKTVHYDRDVKATLEKSVPQVGADKVWETYGSQGEGIKVGIIDSGIDYMHPALGGGFGMSFKVVGGYDFVNLDSDPVDDNGHGTHVAGIVSANSPELKGIAPKSILYAYKVLNDDGNGLESDIISAVERVVDPNEDGDMSDKLDVVNMSLGSDQGNPNDASSVAVNNASRLGVIFVIAAGNSGYGSSVPGKENNYFYNGSATIGSPGTAELAITVGAVDSTDQLAKFSSKGPNKTTFSIKPEVLAPGVKIQSAYLGQTTERLNGTSMATPMVTGVVALLKSIHPDWNPERIKSAIVNTAKDVGLTAYRQGGGRVQALKAVGSSSWVSPAVLNLGLDDPAIASWIRKDTFYVHNSNNTSQSFTTAVSGLQSGITITVSPSGFSVSSGDSAEVIVTATVNNSTIQIVADDIPLYTGRIAINGTVDTITVPWAFARASRLTIAFNEPMPFFLGTNVEPPIYGGGSDVNWISPTTAELYGFKKGTYDFYALFPSTGRSKIVFKENVALNNDSPVLAISSNEATVPLVYRSKDHEGNLLSTYPSARKVLVNSIPNWGDQVALFEQTSDTIMVSPASTRYSFRPIEYQFNPAATNSFHFAQYSSFAGISSGKSFTNNVSDYISQNFRFQYPPNTQQTLIAGEFFGYKEHSGIGSLNGMGADIDTVSTVNNEYTIKGYFQRSLEQSTDVALNFYSANNLETEFFDLATFPVMLYHDSVIAMMKDNAMLTVPRSQDGGTMSFGDAPVYLMTLWYNNVFSAGSIHFSTLFRGVHREQRVSDVNDGTYTVYDKNGAMVFTNPLNDFPRAPREFLPERYKMVIQSSSYWLRNNKGTIQQTAEFDLSKTPANPPSITSFAVLNEQGLPVNSLVQGGNGSLMFSSEVVNFMSSTQVQKDSTKVWYRVHGTVEWHPLPVQVIAVVPEKDGTVFKSDLASALSVDSVAIDLRIFVKDSVGFTNEFQIEPAFAVGNWIGGDPTDVEEEPQSSIPKVFTLHQNFPNPFNPSTTIRFGLPEQSSVQVEIFNLLGQRIKLLDRGVLPAGFHNAQWNADVPSGVYFYRVVMNSSERNSRSVSQTRKMLLLR